MELGEAFKRAAQKFYEGANFENTIKHDPRASEFSFSALDKVHKELKTPKKPVVDEPELEDNPMEEEME